MNKEPDIIISISGDHSAKGILAVVIANALKEADVKNVNHLSYDEETFAIMTNAVNESNENTLSTANVLIVEFEEDEIDSTYVQNETPPVDPNPDVNAWTGKNPDLTDEDVEQWKKNVTSGVTND